MLSCASDALAAATFWSMFVGSYESPDALLVLSSEEITVYGEARLDTDGALLVLVLGRCAFYAFVRRRRKAAAGNPPYGRLDDRWLARRQARE